MSNNSLSPALLILISDAQETTTETPTAFPTNFEITQCNQTNQDTCALLSNRTCYNYDETDTHECGYCLNGYIEIPDKLNEISDLYKFDTDDNTAFLNTTTCYRIDDIPTEEFTLLAKLLEYYLPDYIDQTITTEVRTQQLVKVAKIISYWNAIVPPPEFRLGLNQELFLSEEERKGRLGNFLDEVRMQYVPLGRGDDAALGERDLERFIVGGINDLDEDGEVDEEEDGTAASVRRLTPYKATTARKLETPSSKDWHALGAVTPVKNQAKCGCCWAVAATAAIESAMLIYNHTSWDRRMEEGLSIQQMISCDKEQSGCQGGNILKAMKYAWEHDDLGNGNYGGLVSESAYPYVDHFGVTSTTCNVAGKTPKVFLNYPKIVTSINDRSSFEERRDLTKAAVAMQPIASVLKSGCDLFSTYQQGVLTHDEGCDCCSTSCIDHAVVIVGYDTNPLNGDPPYWKLRNSWGANWGEEGYFRIAMNDPGCGWGLFGMLAESAIPADVYKTKEELPERPGWWETAQGWEKTLVVLASVLGFLCLCCCFVGLWKKRGGSSEVGL